MLLYQRPVDTAALTSFTEEHLYRQVVHPVLKGPESRTGFLSNQTHAELPLVFGRGFLPGRTENLAGLGALAGLGW